jgi:lipopolysaccharide/colanic/teichoic acid biosynthesis glycosyltransferase
VNYIESRCFWVDVKILAKTLPAVISGKGAC